MFNCSKLYENEFIFRNVQIQVLGLVQITRKLNDHSKIPLMRIVGWEGEEEMSRQGPRLSIRIDIWILPSDTIRG